MTTVDLAIDMNRTTTTRLSKISTSTTQVTTYDYMDTFYIGLGVRLLQRCESISIFYEELVYTVL